MDAPPADRADSTVGPCRNRGCQNALAWRCLSSRACTGASVACYPYVFLTVELQSAFVITAATLGLFSFYYNASTGDYLKIVAVSLALTGVAVLITLVRTFPLHAPDP